MRTGLVVGLAMFCSAFLVETASAKIDVRVNTTTYPIVGSTGYDLLKQMDRKGPKHGFLTRAIAQTRYSVKWDISWKSQNRVCRVDNVSAVLNIHYSYPKVATRMSPALGKRWNAFMRGVQKHEEMHGSIARRMVRAAEKSISGLAVKNDPACKRAKSEVKRRVQAIYAKYEADQVAFDDREHRDNGNVSKLVERLAR